MTSLATAPAMLLALQLGPGAANGWMGPVFMYGAIFLIFYFVLIRPQQQQRKKHEETIRAIKRGDEIVTAGGIVGEVVSIKQAGEQPSADDRVTIRSGESRLVVERGRIVRTATTAAPAAPQATAG